MKRNLYVALVALAGVALLAFTLSDVPRDEAPAIVLLAVLAALAQRMPVSLFGSSSVSVSVAFAFSGMLLFGPGAGILVNLPSVVVHALHPKARPLHKSVFNAGLLSVAVGCSGLLYLVLGGQMPIASYVESVPAVVAAMLAYFLIQTTGVTMAILLSEGGSFSRIWDGNYRWLLLNYLAMAGVSIGMALAYGSLGPLGMLSFSLPLVMAWYSFRLYMVNSKAVRAQNASLELVNGRLEEGFQSIIRALAATAASKDHYTREQSETAMRYATATARRLGLDATEVAAAQLGALFHDIGKIEIAESILDKAGDLSGEEWQVIRQHPLLGARVMEQVPTLRDVAPVILSHHERFDGEGYPNRLRGEEIPRTAQIVAVVECYQAMTSDRPYRPARSHEHAVSELRRQAGTQFNPVVVEAFIAAREAESIETDGAFHLDLSPLLRARQPVAAAARM